MVAVAGSVARARPAIGPTGRETVDRLALWLLVVVGLDLVLTRFLVRLAIFVPKGEPFASAAAALGRVGAAADALVPIVGGLLLGALLLRAARAGSRAGQATLVAIVVVGVGGLGLVAYPPVPAVVVALGLLVGAVAVAAGLRALADAMIPITARLGLGSLAVSAAAAAVASALDASGMAVDQNVAWPEGVGGQVTIVGQVAFVAGAALTGFGGLLGAGRSDSTDRRAIAVAILMAAAVVLVDERAPATWGALVIWSIGLTATIPAAAVAIALGLAVGGLPGLHRRAPSVAVGAGIVLLAGYGLAASGLVLATLLGLVVAGSHQPSVRASPDQDAANAGRMGM